MAELIKADPNMNLSSANEKLKYVDVRKIDAKIYGLTENEYHRLPKEVRKKASKSLLYLENNLSGGRVRFKTNSKLIGIKVRLKNKGLIYNFSNIGFSGIDCYKGQRHPLEFIGFCAPAIGKRKAQTQIKLSGEEELITMYLPIYNSIKSLEIAVEDGAYIKAPPEYEREKPIIFYGSSITQGGCASRAGNSYPALVSRYLDSDFICLGFSGNAKGEDFMAQYIAKQNMSAFVYDYDFNAPNKEHLLKTHKRFLKIILDSQPELPVIIMSKPSAKLEGEDIERREIIRKTYNWAKDEGYNVHFIDGETLFGTLGSECCTVDKIHPNDLGFYRMAQSVYPVLKNILK